MFADYSFSVRERLLRYVQIDTQSDPHSPQTPSTEKQKDLGRLLLSELKALGIADAEMDEFGYVYASLPGNSDKAVPAICYCAHMDTAPDCSGTGVKPLVHENYSGEDIILPDDPDQVIRTADHPYLLSRIGDDIVTASGTTLLGADDKAGIAVIMDTLQYLLAHPELKHGTIKILFTPDEEIGRGVDKVNIGRVGAAYGYTLDGGERGSLEFENFSADGFSVIFHGISAHPGTARGKMVNALKVAAHFLDSLPREELSPESTDGRYGFVHPVHMDGMTERAKVDFIIRDFITEKLEAYENYLRDKAEEAVRRFPGAVAEFQVKEQYRNMKLVIDEHPQGIDYAREALQRAGCEIRSEGIRGGTDGARLSFMGMPCPNLFTGEMALHGKHEYVSVQDMQKSVETLVHLAMIWEEKS